MTEIQADQIERFWGKVDRGPGQGPNGDCWEWQGGMKNDVGYGGFYLRQIDNTISTHVFAFLLEHRFGLDDIPNGVVIRHRCNNPRCVRPDHLALGTHLDNSADMVLADRSLKGTRNPNAKLDWDRVAEVRALWATGLHTKMALAERFGVSAPVIWHIVTNRTWCDPTYTPPTFPDVRNHSCKFPNSKIEAVREDRKNGIPVREISKRHGVSVSQIYNIITGRQRKEE